MRCKISCSNSACARRQSFVCTGSGPKFTINVSDPSLPYGVGSLGLEGEYQREIVDNVNAGVKYDYNVNRGLPSSVWVSTFADIDDATRLSAKAEYDVDSKATFIEARLERGDDAVSIDFDTNTNGKPQLPQLRTCLCVKPTGSIC